MPISRRERLAKKEILLFNVPNLYDKMAGILSKCPAAVNALTSCNETPLVKLLKSKHCSLRIVNLLIYYNVDVNFEDAFGHTPLYLALYYSRSPEIIKELMLAGAYPWRKDCFCKVKKCILCKAFQTRAIQYSSDLLLSKSTVTPIKQFSAWVCALNTEDAYKQEFTFRMLINRGFDINAVNGYRQTVLCFALQMRDSTPHLIKLLLRMGASLSACKYHDTSSLHCLMSEFGNTHFTFQQRWTKEVLEVLLDAGACPNLLDCYSRTPLQCALLETKFEYEGIKLLLDQPGADVNITLKDSKVELLACALLNSDCTPSVVKLLIKRGARVNNIDEYGNTSLHYAAKNCSPSVIRVLLNEGAIVDVANVEDVTPLTMALYCTRDSAVINVLIAGGASIPLIQDDLRLSIILSLLLSYDKKKCQQTLTNFKSMGRYFFLQPTDNKIIPFFDDLKNYEIFSNFGGECFRELWKMDSVDVGYGHTLRHFICGCSLQIDAAEDRIKFKKSVIYRLIKVRADKLFPIFFDVMLALVGKQGLVAKLEEVRVYNLQECPDLPFKEKKVMLNHESTSKIASYLSDRDLFMLLLAFPG